MQTINTEAQMTWSTWNSYEALATVHAKKKKEKKRKKHSLLKTVPLPLPFQNWPVVILVRICLIKPNLKIKKTGFFTLPCKN